MTDAAQPAAPPAPAVARVRIFVDFWNFHLAVKRHNGGKDFNLDWRLLGPWLARRCWSSLDLREGLRELERKKG